jgi:hypothetical protein
MQHEQFIIVILQAAFRMCMQLADIDDILDECIDSIEL